MVWVRHHLQVADTPKSPRPRKGRVGYGMGEQPPIGGYTRVPPPFRGLGDLGASAVRGLCLTRLIPPLGAPIPPRPLHGQGNPGVSAARGLCLTYTIPSLGVPIPTRPFHGQGDVSAARGLCLTCARLPLGVPIPTRPFQGLGGSGLSAAWRVVSHPYHTPTGCPYPHTALPWPARLACMYRGLCLTHSILSGVPPEST